MLLVRQDPQVPSVSSTLDPYSAFFQPFWCQPRLPKRTIFVFGEQKDMPSPKLFSPNSQQNFLNLSSPPQSGKLGVHTSFVQEEPLGLRCLTKILATGVGEDVSIYLDILTLEFQAIWERPLGYKQADDPCSVNAPYAPE